ncbi:hypothetical protein R1sor_003942 [Riccia sorocarpa]|uniref:Uncharacterized protein n=1 Tax=Riccia sorocarpa TaxID=122646 RepID=A0ABD3H342_9MARC
MVCVHEFHPVQEDSGIDRRVVLRVLTVMVRGTGAVVAVKSVDVEECGFVVFYGPHAESCGVSGTPVGYGGSHLDECVAHFRCIVSFSDLFSLRAGRVGLWRFWRMPRLEGSGRASLRRFLPALML